MITEAPGGYPLLGHLTQFATSPLDFIGRIAPQSDVIRFRLGPYQSYFMHQAEHVYEVLVAQADKFQKDPLTKQAGGKFLGNGLITNDGDSHRQQRKRLQPAFYHKRLEPYAAIVVEETQKLVNTWRDGDVISIEPSVAEVLLRTVSRSLFGTDIPGDIRSLQATLADFQESLNRELRSPIAIIMPDWMPTNHKRQLRKAVRSLDAIIQQVIDQHRQDGQDRGDLLSMLMLTSEENTMSDQRLRDEVVTLFIAGHETTTYLMCWLWYLLGRHPEIEAKIRAEVDRVLQGRQPTFSDLANLKYTEMVSKEALRLYPPAWMFTRQALDSVQIGDVQLAKGDLVYVSPYITHHEARYFDDPHQFCPERFTEDAEKRMPHGAYFPFSAGPRICLGQAFALMETQLLLATMINSVQLVPVDHDEVAIIGLAILKPARPITMHVQRRNP